MTSSFLVCLPVVLFERVYGNCVQRKVFIGSILSTNKNNRKWRLPCECITLLLCENWLRRSVFFFFSASPRHCTIFSDRIFPRFVSGRIFLTLWIVFVCFCVFCVLLLLVSNFTYTDSMRKWTWMRACIFFCLVPPYVYCLFSVLRTWWYGVLGSFTCGSQLSGVTLESKWSGPSVALGTFLLFACSIFFTDPSALSFHIYLFLRYFFPSSRLYCGRHKRGVRERTNPATKSVIYILYIFL